MTPTMEALTSSIMPSRSATSEMINSGALPKVALSMAPSATWVRCAICSVATTINLASGMKARAETTNLSSAW